MNGFVFVLFFSLIFASFVSAKTFGEERDAAFRLQIFLDQKNFGPGVIDGHPGTFTQRAIAAYNSTLGRAEDDVASVQEEADEVVSTTFVTAVVPNSAERFVNFKLPYKRTQQAEEKSLVYRSYLEYMAERYHTSEKVLTELNGKKITWGLAPKKTLVVPNVEPFQIEEIRAGRVYRADEGELSARRVVIDTKLKQILIYAPIETGLASTEEQVAIAKEEDPKFQLVASFPTTPGYERFIHRGTWTLKNCLEWPVWRYDKQLLKTGKRGKEALDIPGGPNNPVGILWAGLSKSGIGIHGTDSPRTIGRSRSSGCFRLANWDAARVPSLIRPGSEVIVK
ncbi:MAG: L,D-transpeptidase [Verrucomicrobiota bacterium]